MGFVCWAVTLRAIIVAVQPVLPKITLTHETIF